MLLQRIREGVPTAAVGYEIEIVGLGRVQSRFDGGLARVADRSRGEALDLVGVVRVLGVDLGLLDRLAPLHRPAIEPIKYSRVRLQLHAFAQAIDKHARNLLALIGTAGFFFNHRGQNERLLWRLER